VLYGAAVLLFGGGLVTVTPVSSRLSLLYSYRVNNFVAGGAGPVQRIPSAGVGSE